MIRNHNFLFELRFRLSSGPIQIRAWESTTRNWKDTHTRLDCELRQNGKVVFPFGQTYVGIPSHSSIDGNYAREAVCSLFAMKPGDTDREYFESYTPDQLDWAECNGEELDMLKSDRFCEGMSKWDSKMPTGHINWHGAYAMRKWLRPMVEKVNNILRDPNTSPETRRVLVEFTRNFLTEQGNWFGCDRLSTALLNSSIMAPNNPEHKNLPENAFKDDPNAVFFWFWTHSHY